MTSVRHEKFARHPIPAALNVALVVFQIGASIALLAAASHAESTAAFLLAVLAFSFVMQMGFSLIHEAEHDKLHPSRAVNDVSGLLLAALFPGSYQLMKMAHLSHHRKNRSDAELVDYVRPGEKRAWKWTQYYLLIHGLIWVGVPLLSVLVSLVPGGLLSRRRSEKPSGGAALYLAFVRECGAWRVRAETAFTVLLWWALFSLCGPTWEAVGIAYAAFAFSWASQQYIYHIRTPRHLVEGAFNLRLAAPLRLLYLNFNYHLTHHRDVTVPWIHLPALTDDAPQQRYLRAYLALWAPPEPLDRAFPRELQTKGPLPRTRPGFL